MRILAATAAVAVLATSAAPAMAADATYDRDVRCLAAALVLGSSDDQELSDAAVMMSIYFAGRVEPRTPDEDAMGVAAKVAEKLTEADLLALATQCGGILSEKGKRWQAQGEAMQAQEARK